MLGLGKMSNLVNFADKAIAQENEKLRDVLDLALDVILSANTFFMSVNDFHPSVIDSLEIESYDYFRSYQKFFYVAHKTLGEVGYEVS